MTTDGVLGLCALIIAVGGAVEVIRRYCVMPVIRLVQLIQRMAANVADLLERMTAVETNAEQTARDVAEIKGALKATGILPADDD